REVVVLLHTQDPRVWVYPRNTAGLRPQDGERRDEYRVRPADDGGRYPRPSCRQQDRAVEWLNASLRRSGFATRRAAPVRNARPSLADPARALCLQSPQTRMLALSDQ